MIGWFIFVIGSSIVEGFLWHHYKGKHPKGFRWQNIHLWLVLMRFGAVLPFWGWSLPFYVFTFPLVHDGVYYTTRNFLRRGTYPKWFFDTSKKSTALLTLPFGWRLAFALVGLLFLIP